MSKKASSKKFTYTPTNELPPLSTIKTEWDLASHYYQSEDDPQIEKDAKAYEKAVRAFVKKYQTSDFTSNEEKLFAALKDSDKLEELATGSKIVRYFSFRGVLDVNDNAANRKLAQFGERFRKLGNEMLFFPLQIGKIDIATQKKYLQSELLSPYRYLLKQNFEDAKHHLSEAEERILSLRSNTSSGMWADAVEKIISNRSVTFKKETIPVPEALERMDALSWNDKNTLWNLILLEMKQISEVAEHELTAIVTHSKVSDELRKYKKPYSATVQGYENNEKAVEALVDAISTKGFALSKKFYKLKAKLHKLSSIPYANKYDPIGDLSHPDFETAVRACRDTFYGLDEEFGKFFDRMLENGHIDAFPKKGKRGGVFMSATIGLPTYVMLNHTTDFKSLETMAHEVGHAIHAEFSKVQPAIYEEFSTTTAETASTLFEQLTMRKLLDVLPDEQKVIFLHNKISRDIATVQRQIAFFNFELEMHEHIRAHGRATKEELAAMMKKHLESYLGEGVTVTEDDGYSYVYIPHIRYGFYVYTYSYGHLVSNLMIKKVTADPAYLGKIKKFLHAGGSDTVENIFKSIGINTNKVETFLESLKTQEEEIKELEKLTKKLT